MGARFAGSRYTGRHCRGERGNKSLGDDDDRKMRRTALGSRGREGAGEWRDLRGEVIWNAGDSTFNQIRFALVRSRSPSGVVQDTF